MCKIIIWDIKINVFPDEIKTEKYQHSQSDDFCEFCLDIWIEFRPNRTCRKLPVFSWPYMYFFRRRIWVGVVGCRTSTKVGLLDLKKEFKKNKSLKAFKTMSKLLPLHRGDIDLPRQTDMHIVISHTVQIISNLITSRYVRTFEKRISSDDIDTIFIVSFFECDWMQASDVAEFKKSFRWFQIWQVSVTRVRVHRSDMDPDTTSDIRVHQTLM